MGEFIRSFSPFFLFRSLSLSLSLSHSLARALSTLLTLLISIEAYSIVLALIQLRSRHHLKFSSIYVSRSLTVSVHLTVYRYHTRIRTASHALYDTE